MNMLTIDDLLAKIKEYNFESTPIDLAYKIHIELGNTMVAAKVNDEYVPVEYQLRNQDRVKIINDPLSFGPRKEWLDKIQTTKAKRKTLKFNE